MTSAGFDEPRVFARSHRLRQRVLLFSFGSALLGLTRRSHILLYQPVRASGEAA